MAVRAVLIDLDDTLFDHDGATRTALAAVRAQDAALAARDFEALVADYRVLLERVHAEVLAGRLSPDVARRQRFEALLGSSGSRASRAAVIATVRCYRDTYDAAWRAIGGAAALLGQIRDAGRPVVVVTNNFVAEQRRKLDRCALSQFVTALVTAEEVGASKPDGRMFATALARAGAPPAEAVMVGDSWDGDVLGARAAGIRPVWFNRHRRPSPDPSVDEVHALEPVADVLRLLGL